MDTTVCVLLDLHQPMSADLCATFGLYPAAGDRHVSEFFSTYLAPTPRRLSGACKAATT